MAYSDDLKAEKRSYERDLGRLNSASKQLEKAKDELKDDPSRSLVEKFKNYLVVDDNYFDKDNIERIYDYIDDASDAVDGWISSVEGKIRDLEEEIEEAEREEAEEDD